jgi:hypothetical protein
MRARVSIGLGLGLLAAAALAQPPSPAGTPDLSGHWRLNLRRSNDIEKALAESAGSEDVAGGGAHEHLLPRGNEASEVDRLALRKWLAATVERARTEPLVIEQSERELKAGIGDDVRIFYFGREATSQDARGVRRKTQMRWEGSQLVIEETGEDGMKLAHMYTLLPDGKNLIVAYRITGPQLHKPLDLRLVFDRSAQ